MWRSMWPMLLAWCSNWNRSRSSPRFASTRTRSKSHPLAAAQLPRGGSSRTRHSATCRTCPDELIDIIRRSLRGENFVPLGQPSRDTARVCTGRCRPVALTLQRLDFASVLVRQALPRARAGAGNGGLAAIGPRTTKLATTRWWPHHDAGRGLRRGSSTRTTCTRHDWLLARQERVQRSRRAAPEPGQPWCSTTCRRATSRAAAVRWQVGLQPRRQRGLLQVNYGLAHRSARLPVAVSVYEGNVSDSQTFMPEVGSACARTSASSSW